MAKRDSASETETPGPDFPASKPMTLQEARGAFLPFLQAWRGMARMAEAVEAALTAEAALRQTIGERERALADLAKIATDRQAADEGLALARQGLTGVQDATRVAREELETVRRQIKDEQAAETRRQADVKKAWVAERLAIEKEINAENARLAKVRADFAAVVKQHAA
jgi:hypothetical protein